MLSKSIGKKTIEMGILGNIFKPKQSAPHQENSSLSWHLLSTLEQLAEIENESATHPVVIFKHSTRCGISRMVLKRFEKEFDLPKEKMTLYLLDLLSYREISQEIALRFDVIHESPQLLVIQDKKVIYAVSHHAIQAADLSQFSK